MAIIPEFTYEDGYRISRFNTKNVYLKFKQNRFTDNNIGHIKLHIHDENGNGGTIAFTVTNIYDYMPSFYWIQEATTLDDALENIYFSYASSPSASIVNNNRQLIQYDEENSDALGRTWHRNTEADKEITINEIMEHFESRTMTVEVDADFPIFIDWTENPDGNYPDGNYTFRSEDFNHGNYDREISVYGSTDNLDKAENYYTSVTEIDSSDIYYLTNYVYKNGVLVQSVNYQFQFAKKGRNYVYVDGQHAEFRTTLSTFKVQTGASPVFTVVDEVPDALLHLYDSGDWVDFNTGDNYTSHLYTNLKVVYNHEDEEGYIGGWIPDDETPKHPSNIGNGLTSNNVNTTTCEWIGETVYDMTETQLKEIFDEVLYTPDDNIIDDIKKGLWLWNSDPIKCITGLYYVPFSVSTFFAEASGAFKLGNYTPTQDGGGTYFRNYLNPNGTMKPITLFNTFFTPIYNDFRDYTHVKYELFLPFKSFVELDNSKYLNKQVKCDMIFDPMTHEVRYFLYCNGVITDRFDCSVGIEMPLISDSKTERVGGIKQAVGGAVSVAQGLNLPSTTSITGGVANLIGGLSTMVSHPSTDIEGDYSSGLNIYDIRYAYLKITTNETIKPSNLNTVYGYPSYFIGRGSELSGYTEISDIRVNSFTGTAEELEDLKQRCKSGIIL